MKNIILTGTMCITELIGFSNPMTSKEKQILKAISPRCALVYKDAPCLIKLVKKDENVYNATCGQNNGVKK